MIKYIFPLFITLTIVMVLASTYALGQKQASFSIARQCALENSFIEHGNEFYCQDINDYHAD